uniref:ATP-dependent Clp protease proteolytic subunit n=1 Tax=Cytinus hypocistis TaxID=327100 RepID=A0A1B0VF36_9ROSI|nr:ATP-dependent Clp protease proteolytic subunit [Cytinus hypocistis]AMR36144.1 ATP-dependent Clp protease proteolytic subunit [Cytinus hypocistis]
MPVGVPKVPKKKKKKEEVMWVDLYTRVHQERLIFLGQELTYKLGNQIMGLMIYLSIDDEHRDQFMFINSPGGLIVPGIGIFDTMQYIQPEVVTICMGLAASMGSFILLGGELTRRLALNHARIMIHQPISSFFEAPAVDFLLEAGELLKLREIVVGVYSRRTGKPKWLISEDMERDYFMSADEAKIYGIVDDVGI